VFFTCILKDLAHRIAAAGIGNEVNDGVKRYRANQAAVDRLAWFYTPTGRLSHPMFAIHTTSDPLVPP
jgi:hypothetical protein